MAGPPTETEFADWVRAPSAFAYAKAHFKGEWAAQDAILRSVEIGDMIAVARMMMRRLVAPVGEPSPMWIIPRGEWSKMELTVHSEFWKNGGITYSDGSRGMMPPQWQLLDVRFDPVGFARIVPRQEAPPISGEGPLAPAKHAGGRPRGDHWEDLFIEIARQLYAGELIPKKQVDIENAMSDWVEANHAKAGPFVIRQRARKLWHALQSGDG